MLERYEHGAVLELRLARPPANALSPQLIATLRDAVDEAQYGAQAIVISGAAGMFSGGLDVPELLELDRPAMHEVVRDFFAMMRVLAASPVPIAAAITGHSPAGGAVIALFCDYRVMAAGPFKIGLNEVQVGLSVPTPILAALVRAVGGHAAAKLAVPGRMISAEEALAVGLVDELAPLGEVVPRAVAWCQELVALPPQARAKTREYCRRDLLAAFADLEAAAFDRFLDEWFSAETQGTMWALAERLRQKKTGAS